MKRAKEVAREICKTCIWKSVAGASITGDTFFCIFPKCIKDKEEKIELKNNLQGIKRTKRI